MRMTSKVYILRWGHRPRDLRLTSHIVLAARALGASGVYLSDVADRAVKRTVDKVVEEWGGEFEFKMAVPWRKTIQEWRDKAIIVHLTMYGENIEGSNVMKRIKKTGRVVVVHEAPRTCGYGSELVALVTERAFLHLQAPPVRVTGFDTPFPLTHEREYLPLAHRIAPALLETARY